MKADVRSIAVRAVWIVLFGTSSAIAAVMNADALHDEIYRMLPWTYDSCHLWTLPAILLPATIGLLSLVVTFRFRLIGELFWTIARWGSLALCTYWAVVILFGRGFCESGIE